MSTRPYYSARSGTNPNTKPDLALLLRLFRAAYQDFERRFYFQEAFGYDCVDSGYAPGTLGSDIEAAMFLALRRDDVWPISARSASYSEEALFDVIEFLHDHVSKPDEGYYHSWNSCGWHYRTFDSEAGRLEFRRRMNELLKDYGDGYELSAAGEVLLIGEPALESLLKASVQSGDPTNVDARVSAAVLKFRRYKSSADDRRDAVRDLADVLEYLRPRVKEVLSSKDEADIFILANNFGIRHHNAGQKTDYDKHIWLRWAFYYYLATIQAIVETGRQTTHWVSTFGVNTDDLVNGDSIDRAGLNPPSYEYPLLCDWLRGRLLEQLNASHPTPVSLAEPDMRTGNTLTVRVQFEWDPVESELRLRPEDEWWERSELRPYVDVYGEQ